MFVFFIAVKIILIRQFKEHNILSLSLWSENEETILISNSWMINIKLDHVKKLSLPDLVKLFVIVLEIFHCYDKAKTDRKLELFFRQAFIWSALVP